MIDGSALAPVPGFPGYLVSTEGQVVSDLGSARRVLKPYFDKQGYACLRLNQGDSRPHVFVHTLVLLAYVGPKPDDAPLCRHLNGDNTDNRVENLAWGTHSDNLRDAVRHGTAHTVRPIVGEPPRARKLTTEQVLEIVRRSKDGESERSVARDFGIHPTYVGRLKRGRNWRHLWETV